MPNKPKSESRPACMVITIPDPDNMPVSAHAERGGTLQWRTETHRYPEFEIRFQGSNPFNAEKDLVLKGSDDKPVVLRLNTVGENYKYTIRHINKDGTCVDSGPRMFNVRICIGCL
jgi:hypothetical protein